MEERINFVLDELLFIEAALHNGGCHKAYAGYLDFKGDIQRLSAADKEAAEQLLAVATEGYRLEKHCFLLDY